MKKQYDILFEDSSILVINKTAGITVEKSIEDLILNSKFVTGRPII